MTKEKKEVFSETPFQSLLLSVCFSWRGHFLEFGIRCHWGCPRTLMDQSLSYQPSPGLSSAYLWPLSVWLTASLLVHTWRLLHSPAVLPPQDSMTTTISGGAFTLKNTVTWSLCATCVEWRVRMPLWPPAHCSCRVFLKPLQALNYTDTRIFLWIKTHVSCGLFIKKKVSFYVFSEFYFWSLFFVAKSWMKLKLLLHTTSSLYLYFFCASRLIYIK